MLNILAAKLMAAALERRAEFEALYKVKKAAEAAGGSVSWSACGLHLELSVSCLNIMEIVKTTEGKAVLSIDRKKFPIPPEVYPVYTEGVEVLFYAY